MNRNLSYKLGAIAILIALLLIPLLMIGGLIQDRQEQRDQVVRDIAQSSSFAQQISGPMLVVPYRKIERRWKTEDGKSYQEASQVAGHLYFLPETFDLKAGIDTELRSRGIYEARLFHADNHISGQFKIPANWGITEDFADYRFDPAFLVVGISDIRGIEKGLQLQLNEQRLDFAAGTKLSWMSGGVHALLPGIARPRPCSITRSTSACKAPDSCTCCRWAAALR
jgi:inner membrane protein